MIGCGHFAHISGDTMRLSARFIDDCLCRTFDPFCIPAVNGDLTAFASKR